MRLTSTVMGEEPEGLARVKYAIQHTLPAGYTLGNLEPRGPGARRSSGPGARRSEAAPAAKGASNGTKGPSRNIFRDVGTHCEAIFNGLEKFTILKTLGAQYVEYLLRRPHRVIRVWDLEKEIHPQKGEARGEGSMQGTFDVKAEQELAQEILANTRELEKTRAEGNTATAARLEAELKVLRSGMKKEAPMASDCKP